MIKSSLTDRDDQRPDVESETFSATVARTIFSINQQFLRLLSRAVEAWPAFRTFGEQLQSAPHLIDAIATQSPILLCDIQFGNAARWRSVIPLAVPPGGEHHLTPSDLIVLTHSVLVFAWYVIRRRPDDASLLLGIHPEVAQILDSLELIQLHELAAVCSPWIAPRLPDRHEVLQQVISLASTVAQLPPDTLRARVLEIMLGSMS